jgi:hypothetical protein
MLELRLLRVFVSLIVEIVAVQRLHGGEVAGLLLIGGNVPRGHIDGGPLACVLQFMQAYQRGAAQHL